MRVYEDPEFRLVATDSSLGLSALLFAAGALLLSVGLLGSGRHALGSMVSAGFFLLCALLLVRSTRFVFDRAQRTLTWQRRRILSRSSGQVPFADIRGVVVETNELARGSGSGTYRLALTTSSGSIPFSDAYRSNVARCESMRDQIVAFLGLRNASSSETASAEDDLRELVRQRRILDAVALLRAREHIGLTEARRRIEEIEKQTMPGTP